MKHLYYQSFDSHSQIKSKYVSTVEKYFGEKVDRDFLAYIKDFKNLNVNTRICESVYVSIDVFVSMECTIDHKVYEVEGYEVKERSGSIELQEKRNYYTRTYDGYHSKTFYGLWKNISGAEISSTQGYDTTKLREYGSYNPCAEITPAMTAYPSKDEELRKLTADYKREMTKNQSIRDPKVKDYRIKEIYKDSAKSYIYPVHSISFVYKGTAYNVSYGTNGENLEKNKPYFAGEKIPNFTVPFGQHFKDSQYAEVERERKKALTRVRLAPITFGICFPIALTFWILMLSYMSANPTASIGQTIEGVFVPFFFISIAGFIFAIYGLTTAGREIKRIEKMVKSQIENEEEPKIHLLKAKGFYSRLSAIVNILSAVASIALYIYFTISK